MEPMGSRSSRLEFAVFEWKAIGMVGALRGQRPAGRRLPVREERALPILPLQFWPLWLWRVVHAVRGFWAGFDQTVPKDCLPSTLSVVGPTT